MSDGKKPPCFIPTSKQMFPSFPSFSSFPPPFLFAEVSEVGLGCGLTHPMQQHPTFDTFRFPPDKILKNVPFPSLSHKVLSIYNVGDNGREGGWSEKEASQNCGRPGAGNLNLWYKSFYRPRLCHPRMEIKPPTLPSLNLLHVFLIKMVSMWMWYTVHPGVYGVNAELVVGLVFLGDVL